MAIEPWLKEWLGSHNTGLSSLTIMAHFTSPTLVALYKAKGKIDAPYDTSDVNRCVQLLDLAKANGHHWRERMSELAYIPAWAPLLPRWAEIEAALLEDKVNQHAHKIACFTSPKTGRRLKRARMSTPPMPPSRCWWLVSTLRGRGDPYQNQNPHPFKEA